MKSVGKRCEIREMTVPSKIHQGSGRTLVGWEKA